MANLSRTDLARRIWNGSQVLETDEDPDLMGNRLQSSSKGPRCKGHIKAPTSRCFWALFRSSSEFRWPRWVRCSPLAGEDGVLSGQLDQDLTYYRKVDLQREMGCCYQKQKAR